jgi:hypothetical protein
MEFDLDSFPPSSSAQKLPDEVDQNRSTSNADSVIRDDDEFPDIDALLQGSAGTSVNTGLKRRLISYSSKAKRPKVSQPPQPKQRKATNPIEDIFDVPPSPPATSSPFPTAFINKRRASQRNMSEESTLSWTDQDTLYRHHRADLLTPATSAIKPPSDVAFLEPNSDVEDPFATELNEASSNSSSSEPDDSIQIRRVGKKIRGVLPASWLRLDQKEKRLVVQQRSTRDSHSLTPDKVIPRRGVALPRTASAVQSPATTANPGIPFLSDGSDGDQDEFDRDGLAIDEAFGADLGSIFEQPDAVYAMEDDSVLVIEELRNSHTAKPRYKDTEIVPKYVLRIMRGILISRISLYQGYLYIEYPYSKVLLY